MTTEGATCYRNALTEGYLSRYTFVMIICLLDQ
jgi:hypothetical protein